MLLSNTRAVICRTRYVCFCPFAMKMRAVGGVATTYARNVCGVCVVALCALRAPSTRKEVQSKSKSYSGGIRAR